MASFHAFAEVCQALGQTQSRLQIADLAGEFLAGLSVDEAEVAARFMVGRAIEQGEEKRLQVSGRAVWKIVAEMSGAEEQGEEIFAAAVDFGEAVEMALRLRSSSAEPVLSIGEVNRSFAEIAAIEGRNSRRRKLELLRALFERASPLEGKYIAKILIGEMRHGMSEGLMLEAIARMAGRPVAEIRRIHMLEGDVGRVVRILREGSDGRAAEPQTAVASAARVRPLKPMLAHPVRDVGEAFTLLAGPFALEHKLDGARVQIHRTRAGTRIFSRRLNEITQSLPEVVEMVEGLGVREAILDGEVIAVRPDGRPLAFQEVMRRFGRVHDVERLRREQPLELFVFDLLGLEGRLLIDRAYEERIAMLDEVARGASLRTVGRIVPVSRDEAQRFYDAALAAGYEGVMAKSLASPYTPGVRGRGWLKVKRARTLDLVIVAADWGYGRRHGWLSNYHLAARDDETDRFVEVGKTFKGLTDADFREMTERLLALKIGEAHGTVSVRPEIVVEVAYSDIQRSPQYEAGMALRFARIVGLREDKSAQDADTLKNLASAFERQLIKPRSQKT